MMPEFSEISKPSGSLIAYMSGLVKQYGGINLAQGIPGFAPPRELLDELSKLTYSAIHQYPAGNGDPDLIEAIKELYKQNYELNNSEILVLQGATEAISLIYLYMIQKFGKGWSALAFDPIYESYASLPKIYGNELHRSDFVLGGNVDFERLKSDILEKRVKLVFVNSPGNPYGKVWTEEEYAKLLELANELDFYILFDAVYQEVYFGEEKPFNPLSNFSDRTFYVNSFSKMLSITGWRIGYLICDATLQAEIRHIHDYSGLCAVSIIQKAIANYLNKYDLGREYSSYLREQLKISVRLISEPLKEMGFEFEIPSAGYFIWSRLPEPYKDGMDFSLHLYHEQQVSMVPGIHFSLKGQEFVRINIARSEHELKAAISGIQTFLIP